MNIRRIVTGQAAAGAVVVSDAPIAPITVGLMPGAEFHAIWGSDIPVLLPVDGRQPEVGGWLPPTGGFRFGLVTLGPQLAAPPGEVDLVAALAEVQQKLPGMVEVLEPDNPGMHTTDTVDYVVVLSGEAWLELDHKELMLLRAGDTVVQNGTRHAWHNRSDSPCVMAVALVGAERPS